MLIEAIELGSAAAGCALLWKHAIQWRFRSFATSVFLLCYVPLFCVYPVLGRMLSNGAISIKSQSTDSLHSSEIYYIYQAYNVAILAGCLLLSILPTPCAAPQPRGQLNSNLSSFSTHALLACMCTGVYLYIYSTGLSVSELLIASRFEWFLNSNYSSLLSVVASYFVAAAPALVYLAARDDRRLLLVITLVVLLSYGALSKDRKWLIFIASGLFAARYMKTNLQISLSGRGLVWLSLLGVVLAFWQVVRGVLFDSVVTGTTDLVTEVPLMVEQLLTRGDVPYYYNASVTAIHMNINEGFSIPLGVVRRQLFFFLPADYSFGLKIEDISAIFSDAVDGGDEVRRGNMPPGLIGLLVLSFEWWGGLIIALGIPFVLRALDSLIRRHIGIVQVVLVSNFLSATLLLLRGDDSSATYFVAFSIIVLFLIKIVYTVTHRARRVQLRPNQP